MHPISLNRILDLIHKVHITLHYVYGCVYTSLHEKHIFHDKKCSLLLSNFSLDKKKCDIVQVLNNKQRKLVLRYYVLMYVCTGNALMYVSLSMRFHAALNNIETREN